MRNMIEEQIKDLEKIEAKYYNAYNGNIFEMAVYFYMRFGELPAELLEENDLEEFSKILKKQETLMNENINDELSMKWGI